MARNTSFFNQDPQDDAFTSDAQAAAQAAQDAQAAAEAAQAAAEQALADTLAALAAQILDDHADVVVPTPTTLDVLQWDGGNWVNVALPIDNLTDVSAAAPATNDLLQWNGSAWINQVLASTGLLPLVGGTLTGDLIAFQQAPPTILSYATKGYVDNVFAAEVPYDVAGYYDGVTTASDNLLVFVAPRAFNIPANLANSQAYAAVAATAITTFSIRRNGVQVGTFQFAAAAQTATFTLASNENFAQGDRFEIVCPVTPDATLADISVSIEGILGTV